MGTNGGQVVGAFDDAWDTAPQTESAPPVSNFDTAWDDHTEQSGIADKILSVVAIPGSSDADKMIGLAKGAGEGALDLFAKPADLLYKYGNEGLDALTGNTTNLDGFYPSQLTKKLYDSIAGGSGDPQTEKAARLTQDLGLLVAAPSASTAITKAAPELGTIGNLLTKVGALGAEGVGINAVAQSTDADPLKGSLGAAAINTAIPLTGGVFNKIWEYISPTAKAVNGARAIASDIQDVVPNALTGTLSPADRAKIAVASLDTSADAATNSASQKFANLTSDPVNLESAISDIRAEAQRVGGPISPGSQTDTVVNYLENLRPPAQNIPASTTLDIYGNPMTPASTIPAGDAIAPLNQVQNILRDVGKLQRGSAGVDAMVLGKAKGAILDAAEQSVPKAALADLKAARTEWAKMVDNYETGAVGAVRDSLDTGGKLNTFKNRLLNDPKGAEELARVMSPTELENAQHLMLNDLLKFQPVTWEKKLVDKFDSYKAIFGEDKTNNLISMFGRDGTVGAKLLRDNNGLKSLIAKTAFKASIGSAIGFHEDGPTGAAVGAAAALGLTKGGDQVGRIKSILMRAAAGNAEAVALLSAPVRSYATNIAKLATVLNADKATPAVDNLPTQSHLQENKKPLPQSAPNPIKTLLQKTGVSMGAKETLQKIAADPFDAAVFQVESSGGKKPTNDESTAKGAFQLIDATANKLGVHDPLNLDQNYKGFLDLKAENQARFGNDPETLYAAHFLGATVLSHYLKHEPLTDAQQQHVKDFFEIALPHFRNAYRKQTEQITA